MKIFVIGVGGREHALVWKIAQSKRVKKIYCAPGNPGTAQYAENIPVQVDDLVNLLSFARKEKIDLTVVGPELPLVLGISDLFEKHNLHIIGPSRRAAQIEGSKIFAKKFMKKYGIPTANFKAFDNFGEAKKYLKHQKYPLVVKADGMCLGKGVAVCKNQTEAQRFLKSLMVDGMMGEAGKRVIIEDCLSGREVSITAATDGRGFTTFLPSQDHKRAYDKDKGPNTGGMGAYAPVPFVDTSIIQIIEEKIVGPTVMALEEEGCPYKGILYPGLILTDEGPKVLEYNCRFGDPETQPLLMLLKSDVVDVFEAIINEKISKLKLDWHSGAAVCVVLTAKGYPGEYEKGKVIKGLTSSRPSPAQRGAWRDLKAIKIGRNKIPRLQGYQTVPLSLGMTDVVVFQSGTKLINGELVTNSGRVLGVTGRGRNLKGALRTVYGAIGDKGIHFAGMQYRKDIGYQAL